MREQIIIHGGKKLSGSIKISGSKNAALPIMAATILSNEKITLGNLPHLTDVSIMINLLLSLGAKINAKGHGSENNSRGRTIAILPQYINNTEADYHIVSKMRASIVVLGPLLAKFHKAKISLPGGCAIGDRPVNLHLTALEQLGAKITIKNGYIIAKAPNGLNGTTINFPAISVGATENILMAACLAKGQTIINNAAIEPEIIDLMNFLKQIGADITLKNRTFTINGVKSLSSASYNISPDRIEAGSYAVAALATKGSIELLNASPDILDPIKNYLISCGANITIDGNNVRVSYQKNTNNTKLHIKTEPYPGFPTDMQAQLAIICTLQTFPSIIEETIFENRFMHIPELNRMGANIKITGNKLLINQCNKLNGAEVNASDLRASMALVIAGLSASNTTIINNIFHLDRGYEALEEKLFKCGAQIYRQSV